MLRIKDSLALLALVTITAAPTPAGTAEPMSFFLASAGPGDGGNLGGLAGADKHCQMLATAAGSKKTWHAYLSASAAGGQPAVNARDRIGKGPWYNARGVMVARDIADLHSDANTLGKDNSLSEKGDKVNGRGDTPNTHDILTGSLPDGILAVDTLDTTCSNWTGNAATGSAMVGHHDKQGGGARPSSWNSAHPSRGCGQPNLVATGGAGLFYCFAM